MWLFVAAFLAAPALAGASSHFDLSAAFVPKPGGQGEVAVTFTARDPDVRLNRTPAPRLKLDPGQALLVEKAPAPSHDAGGSHLDKYLDTTWPVVFPVTVSPKAPRGEGKVKATVTYFYCSQRKGWCRRGTEEVEIPVAVR